MVCFKKSYIGFKNSAANYKGHSMFLQCQLNFLRSAYEEGIRCAEIYWGEMLMKDLERSRNMRREPSESEAGLTHVTGKGERGELGRKSLGQQHSS